MPSYPRFGVYPAATAAPTAAFDVWEFVEPGTGLLWIPRVKIWQTSDLGDISEEVLTLEWIIGFSVSGSGGQTTNIASNNTLFDADDSFTAESLNTTGANTSTTRTPWADGWNIRMPFNELFTPEDGFELRNAERGVLRCAAPADAITVRTWAQAFQG